MQLQGQIVGGSEERRGICAKLMAGKILFLKRLLKLVEPGDGGGQRGKRNKLAPSLFGAFFLI